MGYVLTKDGIDGNIERTNNFRSDPKVSTGSAAADTSDYKASGYDIVYDKRKSKMMAYVIPNEKTTKPLSSFRTTVESLTGIDFFYQLPDDIENKLESIIHRIKRKSSI